jgi:hypothetical protein
MSVYSSGEEVLYVQKVMGSKPQRHDHVLELEAVSTFKKLIFAISENPSVLVNHLQT